MAERFTRRSQKPMRATSCGFESHLAHDMKKSAEQIDWTPTIAYIVGLIVTDGNLSKDGRHITFKTADYQLATTFKECLNLHYDIKTSPCKRNKERHHYRVQFSDVKFYHWLNDIGIKSAKTYNIGPIKIPDIYFRDFLRGHLDGDGTVTSYNDKNNIYKNIHYENQRIFIRFLSASNLHINWLRSYIFQQTGCLGALITIAPHTDNRVTIWEIKFAKKESLRLIEYIYYSSGLPCLERKKLKAESTKKSILSSVRKKYCRVK